VNAGGNLPGMKSIAVMLLTLVLAFCACGGDEPPPHHDRPQVGTCVAPTKYAPQRLQVDACANPALATCAWYEGTTEEPHPVSGCEPEAGVECVEACS
jgi:hypothetical protein